MAVHCQETAGSSSGTCSSPMRRRRAPQCAARSPPRACAAVESARQCSWLPPRPCSTSKLLAWPSRWRLRVSAARYRAASAPGARRWPGAPSRPGAGGIAAPLRSQRSTGRPARDTPRPRSESDALAPARTPPKRSISQLTSTPARKARVSASAAVRLTGSGRPLSALDADPAAFTVGQSRDSLAAWPARAWRTRSTAMRTS